MVVGLSVLRTEPASGCVSECTQTCASCVNSEQINPDRDQIRWAPSYYQPRGVDEDQQDPTK